jgi:hypothetical protein
MNSINSNEQAKVIKMFSLIEQTELNVPEPEFASSQTESEVLAKEEVPERPLVKDDQFPDQGMYILQEQLKNLRSRVTRIKFYLEDLDDLIL